MKIWNRNIERNELKSCLIESNEQRRYQGVCVIYFSSGVNMLISFTQSAISVKSKDEFGLKSIKYFANQLIWYAQWEWQTKGLFLPENYYVQQHTRDEQAFDETSYSTAGIRSRTRFPPGYCCHIITYTTNRGIASTHNIYKTSETRFNQKGFIHLTNACSLFSSSFYHFTTEMPSMVCEIKIMMTKWTL